MMLTRRKLIGGLGLLIAAPAVIRVADLMPIKAWALGPQYHGITTFEVIDCTLHTRMIAGPPASLEYWLKKIQPDLAQNPKLSWEIVYDSEYVKDPNHKRIWGGRCGCTDTGKYSFTSPLTPVTL